MKSKKIDKDFGKRSLNQYLLADRTLQRRVLRNGCNDLGQHLSLCDIHGHPESLGDRNIDMKLDGHD